MKRKNEKVPEFDEIIFENRNKTYGAFDLRKRYNSTTNLSILGGVAIFSILVMSLTLTTEDGTASSGPKVVVIEISNPDIPKNVAPPELKPPPELTKITKYVAPEVTTDTSQITSFLPTTQEIIETTNNGNVNDTVFYVETTDPVIPPEPKIFTIVEEMPAFPGGNQALLKFIGENLRYPVDAQNNNIPGRVILKFVVNPDGSADRIEIIRSIDLSLDNEAIRVINTLPKFKPGKQGGVPVPVWFTIPVYFKLNIN
jgi:protein TonB